MSFKQIRVTIRNARSGNPLVMVETLSRESGQYVNTVGPLEGRRIETVVADALDFAQVESNKQVERMFQEARAMSGSQPVD